MNREIKFRAWSKQFNFMVAHEDISYHAAIKTHNENGSYFLMQYTGVFDINDKEICEGDIVSYVLRGEKRTELVVFISGCFSLGTCIDLWSATIDKYEEVRRSITIIGNAYEHPELLNQPQC